MKSPARWFATLALATSIVRAGDPPRRVTFDASLLRNARDGAVDLSAFEQGAAIQPGEHDVDIVRNGVPMGRRRVRFEGEDDAAPIACVDRALAAWLEIATGRLAVHARDARDVDAPGVAAPTRSACTPIDTLHDAARAEFDIPTLTLHVSIPQALLLRRDDAIDPSVVDAGVRAFRINYAASVTHQPGDAYARHASLHLDAGANAGAWRWRHRGAHAWSASHARRSQVLASTLERDVMRFDARLTVGDFFVSGTGFDVVGLRGVHFRSDDRMASPDATRHAPIVRGMADTAARVQVRQAGRLLLDVPVPPGPFALEDVRPLARGGALDVRIVGSDGRTRRFELPYSAMPGLLRAGRARFDLAAGLWRDHDDRGDAPVFQGTVQRGLHDRLTLRGGGQLASDHAQALAGAVVSTRIGAMSLDRTRAYSTPHGTRSIGAATRLGWSTQFAPTRTHFDFGAWRRADAHHRSLQDTMRARRSPTHQASSSTERRHVEASLQQTFGARRHALRLTLVDRRFDASPGVRSLQLGYALPTLASGVHLQGLLEQAHDGRKASTQATLSLAVPLQAPADRPPTFLQAHARAGSDHGGVQTDLSGAFGEHARNAWRAGLSTSHRHDAPILATASLSRAGPAGHVAANVGAAAGHRQWSASGNGSIVLHPHGLTLGPPLGETAALVRAEHGAGARLLHVPQGRLDRRGRALVPQLSPYRRNRVGIDPLGAAAGVAFDWTERDVVPRAGAFIDVALPSTRTETRFLRVLDATRAPAAFGARVVDAAGTTRGLVGRNGLALVDSDDDAPLALTWRDAEGAGQCTLKADVVAPHPGDDAIATLACSSDPPTDDAVDDDPATEGSPR